MNTKKLNTAKRKTPKKWGLSKTRANRPSKAELKNLVTYYKEKTAAVSDNEAMEGLDSPERCHFLMLLKIADFAKMGKTFAILTAYKLGYMAGKDGAGNEAHL